MKQLTSIVLVLIVLVALNRSAFAADESKAVADAQSIVKSGLDYLKSQQRPDGTWQRSPREPIAVTALVLRAFARDPATGPKAEFVAKGYQALLACQQDDGSIYKEMLANYNPAIAVSSLAAANDPAYKPAIDKA